MIICLQEDLPKPRFTNGVIFLVEIVESVELLVSVHVESIDRQVVCGKIKSLEDLLQG